MIVLRTNENGEKNDTSATNTRRGRNTKIQLPIVYTLKLLSKATVSFCLHSVRTCNQNIFLQNHATLLNCIKAEKRNFFPGPQLSVVMRGQDGTNSESNL